MKYEPIPPSELDVAFAETVREMRERIDRHYMGPVDVREDMSPVDREFISERQPDKNILARYAGLVCRNFTRFVNKNRRGA